MAKEAKASLIIELKDLVSEGISKIGSAVENLGENLEKSKYLWIGAFGALVAGIGHAVAAFDEEDRVINKLSLALANQNAFSKETVIGLKEQADALQNLTGFSNENILGLQAQLATHGLMGEKLKLTTKLTLDLATSLGIDLPSAARLMGKAFEGETSRLAAYGIKIDESIPITQRFDAVLEKIAATMGGQAVLHGQSLAGQIGIIKEKFSDLEKEIGSVFEPTVTKMIHTIGTMIDRFQGLSAETRTQILIWGTIATAVTGFMAAVGTVAAFMTPLAAAFAAITAPITLAAGAMVALVTGMIIFRDTTTEVANALGTMFNALVTSVSTFAEGMLLLAQFQFSEAFAKIKESAFDAFNAVGKGMDDSTKAMIDGLKKQLEAFKNHANEKDTIRKKDFTNFVNNEAATALTYQENLKKQADAFAQMAQTRVAVANQMFSSVRTLAGDNAKALFVIDKASGIASAIVNTAVAYTQALRSAPPPFNIALANTVAALGGAQVAMIAAQAIAGFAEGGLVMPTAGGTLARIGEAGSREAVIPLDDPKAKQQIAEAMGGGGNITIQVGTLVADEEGVRKLAQEIDRHLFYLQRNRQSVSI